ncbi:peptidase M64 [Jiangella aurantiaca]|uniref:Peptidase M64 n=1 Tax=Jiangella aurantiaca TaxID=2530373 RepID=A0A4R5A8Z4_9ACTN|nr:M64 family metallopeptidase [Jiangella aurantiaca]TDD68095.1 peptidase M64 [Jiangella aurantiaca]
MKKIVAALAPVALGAGLLTVPMAGVPSADEALRQWPEVGSARVVPLQETGSPDERLNLIVICDGYQADEMHKCEEDVDRNQAIQWGVEPFRTYRDYINVYLLQIVSADSGVRRDPGEDAPNEVRDRKNTPLRLWYDVGLTDPLARGITYGPALDPGGCPGHPTTGNGGPTYPLAPGILGDLRCSGNQQRAMYLNSYVAPVLGLAPGVFRPTGGSNSGPQNVQTLAISNTFTYGGIGGRDATASGGSPQSPLISLHELGHSLGTMDDEYPYRDRPRPGAPAPDTEPGSFHHTRMTSEQMAANRVKWWRWLGEESLSGGVIRGADPDGYESGWYLGSNIWRPSSHSIMRWIGFYFDQVGREHMVARITGQRDKGQMSLLHTPSGTVPGDGVLWLETTHPRFHDLQVTWRSGSPTGPVLATGTRNLDLAALNLAPGTVVHVEVRDPVGPEGIDWVRNPSTNNTATDSGYNGPRFVQTRSWTVGETTAAADAVAAEITASTPTVRPVAGDEVVYVETTHPADRVLDVAWTLNGQAVASTGDARTLDLGALDLPAGTHELTATVTDPAAPGASDTVTWTVDKALPTAPRTLSEPLTTMTSDDEHGIYFDGWDMLLEPQDDRTGYDGEPYVVGEFQLNGDGWFNYFGFPEKPQPVSPFEFRHSGTNVKALTYGNLGTGGLSKATFEQSYGPDDPNGPFVPGYGTHTVEHRAVDPAGNIGGAESYTATVLPGAELECTRTVTGTHAGSLLVTSGVTCVDAARVDGTVTVRSGASLVVKDSTVAGSLLADGAGEIQVLGSTVAGQVRVSGTVTGVTAAGSTFRGSVALNGNGRVPGNASEQRYTQYGEAYGPILAGNAFAGRLSCSGSSAPVRDFGAANELHGVATGECSAL